ncbi:MAG TPA: hypothetical protein VHE83_08825 [Mycobacteriales bacterium]|nr:hypothetical protein [Mycobacteriales bacterium]
MSTGAEVRAQVSRVLTGMGLAFDDEDLPGLGSGWSITLGLGAAQMTIWATEHEVGADHPAALLVLNAALVVDLADSEQLARFVSRRSADYLLGNPYVTVADDGRASAHLRHTLLADSMPDADLVAALRMVGLTADQLARTIAAELGGTVAGMPPS